MGGARQLAEGITHTEAPPSGQRPELQRNLSAKTTKVLLTHLFNLALPWSKWAGRQDLTVCVRINCLFAFSRSSTGSVELVEVVFCNECARPLSHCLGRESRNKGKTMRSYHWTLGQGHFTSKAGDEEKGLTLECGQCWGGIYKRV